MHTQKLAGKPLHALAHVIATGPGKRQHEVELDHKKKLMLWQFLCPNAHKVLN